MTNITKTLLDEALKLLSERLQKEFNLKFEENERKMNKIKSDLEAKIYDLEDENKKLKQQFSDLSKNKINHPQLFSNLFSKTKPAEIETKILNAISAESKEKTSKENNVAIFGLKESLKSNKDEKEEEEKQQINEIFTDLNLNIKNIEKHYRLKGTSSRPGIVVVTLKSKSDQQQVIQESKNLNKIEKYKSKVYINQDLTIAERAGLKLLLEERKKLNKEEEDNNSPFRYVIRNDKLEKIKPKLLR